jgi:hypothetical protein
VPPKITMFRIRERRGIMAEREVRTLEGEEAKAAGRKG